MRFIRTTEVVGQLARPFEDVVLGCDFSQGIFLTLRRGDLLQLSEASRKRLLRGERENPSPGDLIVICYGAGIFHDTFQLA